MKTDDSNHLSTGSPWPSRKSIVSTGLVVSFLLVLLFWR